MLDQVEGIVVVVIGGGGWRERDLARGWKRAVVEVLRVLVQGEDAVVEGDAPDAGVRGFAPTEGLAAAEGGVEAEFAEGDGQFAPF